MATFVAADITALTDRIGAIWKRNTDITAATAASEMLAGTGTLITDLSALSLDKGIVAGSAALALQTAAATPYLPASAFSTLVRALNSDVGGLSAYAVTNSLMYYQYFADLCAALSITIAPAVVYKATNQTLATFAATGATTGTFTGTGSLDTSLYGPVQCEVYVTDDIGSSTTVTLTMVKADDTTQSKVVNLTTSHVAGSAVAIGTSTDVYKDCSGIAITGGTTGDAFTVRTKILRTPALV